MITGAQIRAGMALKKLTGKELAEMSGVGWATIQRMAAQDGIPNGLAPNIDKVKKALESTGVEFITENGGGAGVRLRK